MRKIFDEELQELYEQFIDMGETVKKAVSRSVRSFVLHDVELAENVIKKDQVINSNEVSIEKNCFTLIALQQPVASDLRTIVAIMKATSDLERMGDHAVSIARATISVKGNKRILSVEKMLEEMSEIVISMFSRVMKAYVNLDINEAKLIAKEDEKVDGYLRQISSAATQSVLEKPERVMGGMEYLLVAGYLERIGDYITNICERIVYTATGKITELN